MFNILLCIIYILFDVINLMFKFIHTFSKYKINENIDPHIYDYI